MILLATLQDPGLLSLPWKDSSPRFLKPSQRKHDDDPRLWAIVAQCQIGSLVKSKPIVFCSDLLWQNDEETYHTVMNPIEQNVGRT